MRRAAAVVAAVALLAAGCSSSASNEADDPVVSPPAQSEVATGGTLPAPSASAPSVTAPATTAPSTPPTHPPSSPTSATTARTTVPPVPERSTCTKLTIRAIPGGASMGQEIAALQFTNDGSAPCTLAGYPTVTLLRGGAPLGRPSQPSSTAASRRTLGPGEVAESLLHDYVGNCQAPLSDSIRVVAPGSTQSLVRPMQLRACVVRVDKLDAPD